MPHKQTTRAEPGEPVSKSFAAAPPNARLAGAGLAGELVLMTRLLHARSDLGGADGGHGQPLPQEPQIHAVRDDRAGVAGVHGVVRQLAAVKGMTGNERKRKEPYILNPRTEWD